MNKGNYISLGEYEFHLHFTDYGTKAVIVDNKLRILNTTISDTSLCTYQLEAVKDLYYMYSVSENTTYFDADCSIVLDVGNNLSKGIIDNHYENGLMQSALSLLRKRPDLWSHLLSVKRINIIVHHNPDFDCIASVYYLMTSIVQSEGKINLSDEIANSRQIDIIEEYCTLNDRGCLLYHKDFNKVPHILIRFLNKCSYTANYLNQHELMTSQIYKGYELLQIFRNNINMMLWSLNKFSLHETNTNPIRIFAPLDYEAYVNDISDHFSNEIHALENDISLYQKALKNALAASDYIDYIRVPLLSGDKSAGSKLVKAICFREYLECELHKDYARSDGFVFTFIPTKNPNATSCNQQITDCDIYVDRSCRVIISVTEDSNLDLSRVAQYLEIAESRKEKYYLSLQEQSSLLDKKKLVTIKNGNLVKFKKRAGIKRFEEEWCTNSDPWYDGRYNNFSIVDSPSCNSLLSIQEIYETMLNALSEELSHLDLYTILPFTIDRGNHKKNHNTYKAYTKWLEVVKNSGFKIDPSIITESDKLYKYINQFICMKSSDLKAERVSHFIPEVPKLTLFWDKNHVETARIGKAAVKPDYNHPSFDLNLQCIAFRYGIGFILIKYRNVSPTASPISVEELMELNHKLLNGTLHTEKGDQKISDIVMDAIIQVNSANEILLRDVFQFYQPITFNGLKFTDRSMKYTSCELGYKLSNGYSLTDPYNSNCYKEQQYEDTNLSIEGIGDIYISKNGCTYIASENNHPKSEEAIDSFFREHRDIDLLIYILVLQQRYALLNYSEKLAEYTNEHNILDKIAITRLRESFLDFTTQGWFGQVSGFEYLQTLFKRTKEVMEVDNLYEEVDQQIEMIDEYNHAQFNQLVQNISFMGIFLAITNLLGGSNLFDMSDGWKISKYLGISNQLFVLILSILLWLIIMIISFRKKSSKLK